LTDNYVTTTKIPILMNSTNVFAIQFIAQVDPELGKGYALLKEGVHLLKRLKTKKEAVAIVTTYLQALC